MTSNKEIGILVGKWSALLDHLLPLCQIMQVPLLLTDPALYQMAQIFYPEMKLILWDEENKDFDHSFLQSYHCFVYSAFCRLPHGGFRFFDTLYHGEARSIFSFHGNSDKRRNLYWIEQIVDEDIILLYGPQMVDYIKEKGIWKRLRHVVLTGNYRLEYYREHKFFFDSLVDSLLPLDPSRKTLLYAPTWKTEQKYVESRVDYTSVFEAYHAIFDPLPPEYQLIVKWHPLLLENYPGKIEALQKNYKQILFLDDFPLIYPLLERVDYYIGDYSSIGYDFLAYNRPLFFINYSKRRDKGVFLHQCGVTLEPSDLPHLYSLIEKSNPKVHEQARQKMYHYAFGKRKTLDTLKREIDAYRLSNRG